MKHLNKIKWITSLFVILNLLIAVIFYFKEEISMKYSSQKKYSELVTTMYEPEDLQSLHKNILRSRYSDEIIYRKDLEQKYEFECVRKFEGFHEIFDEKYSYIYVVLLDASDGVLYIYFDKNDEAYASYYFDHLLTKADFMDIAEDRSVTDKQIMEIDPNTYILQTSGVYGTAHILSDSLCILEYAQRRINTTVKKKKFYEEKADLEMLYYFIPGILDIDKEEMIKQFN